MVNITVAPYRTNLQLTIFALAAVLLQLVVVPLFLVPETPVLAVVAVVVLSLSTPLNRALLHEAIHGRLARRRNMNDILGRALSIGSGVGFDAMRFGHLAHHRFPRHELDRADVIKAGRGRFAAFVNFYGGLLGWIHLREILASAAMLLPRRVIILLTEQALPKDDSILVLRGAIRRSLARRLRRARTDLLLIAVIYAGALYLYGSSWPVLVLAVAVRALIVSVQDNVAHYGTPPVIGAPAHNSVASRWLTMFMLNSNLHGVHHDRPELPWNALPQAPEAEENLAGNYIALVLRQFQGPRRSFSATALAAQNASPAPSLTA
jgi:fatty acid desaturase